MNATNTNTESIFIKFFNSIIKYNNETSRLLELVIVTTLSILFRIFITLVQLCLLCAFGLSVIFIPLFIITHIYICLYNMYNTYILD